MISHVTKTKLELRIKAGSRHVVAYTITILLDLKSMITGFVGEYEETPLLHTVLI